jgi:hypothetical protein
MLKVIDNNWKRFINFFFTRSRTANADAAPEPQVPSENAQQTHRSSTTSSITQIMTVATTTPAVPLVDVPSAQQSSAISSTPSASLSNPSKEEQLASITTSAQNVEGYSLKNTIWDASTLPALFSRSAPVKTDTQDSKVRDEKSPVNIKKNYDSDLQTAPALSLHQG